MALCFDLNQARVLVNTFLTARARSAPWTGFFSSCTLDALSRRSVMTIPTIVLCTAKLSRCAVGEHGGGVVVDTHHATIRVARVGRGGGVMIVQLVSTAEAFV
jgi:hypothetical protein